MKNKNKNKDNDIDVMVTLDLEDGEQDCEILAVYDVKETGYTYIALLPVDGDGVPFDEDEVYLYRYFEEDGSYSIGNIESDEEENAAAGAFAALAANNQ